MQGIKETPHSLLFLWVLLRKESIGFNQENGEEAEEREGEESASEIECSRLWRDAQKLYSLTFINFWQWQTGTFPDQ